MFIKIYKEKKIPPICSKLIFKRLLLKLTTECSFQFNHQLLKQVEGWTRGGPLSVTFAEIHMVRMENDIVIPLKPIFYRSFVDDIINRRQKNVPDELLFKLNNYHRNITLNIEISPTKFLDTQLVNLHGKIETKVYIKPTKLPVPWSSNIPKRYKRNAINGDSHRSKRIATDFEKEFIQIKNKFLAANFPSRFINSVCNDFLNKENNHENINFIIPPGFFDVKPPVILTEIPYCDKNEVACKQFIKKFNKLTYGKYDNRIKWLTRKMKTLFKLKDPCIHPACKFYRRVCTCGEAYIGEIIRNVETRWKERNIPSNKSNPSKHINTHIDHIFTWSIICNAPTNKFKRKIIGACFIAIMKPTLNDQLDLDLLPLFRNGIT